MTSFEWHFLNTLYFKWRHILKGDGFFFFNINKPYLEMFYKSKGNFYSFYKILFLNNVQIPSYTVP